VELVHLPVTDMFGFVGVLHNSASVFHVVNEFALVLALVYIG
jgi:hypothetical protein